MRFLWKNVYEDFEQEERSRKGRTAHTDMKIKLERNLFGYIKNLFHGKRDKLGKGRLWPEPTVLSLEYQAT